MQGAICRPGGGFMTRCPNCYNTITPDSQSCPSCAYLLIQTEKTPMSHLSAAAPTQARSSGRLQTPPARNSGRLQTPPARHSGRLQPSEEAPPPGEEQPQSTDRPNGT